MRGLRLALAASLLAAGGAIGGAAIATGAPQAILPAMSKKQQKAERRMRFAIANDIPRDRRSKNPPTKRKVKANRLHISKRVCRRHRRAAR